MFRTQTILGKQKWRISTNVRFVKYTSTFVQISVRRNHHYTSQIVFTVIENPLSNDVDAQENAEFKFKYYNADNNCYFQNRPEYIRDCIVNFAMNVLIYLFQVHSAQAHFAAI